MLVLFCYVCCGKTAGVNLNDSRPCCHPEHFAVLRCIVLCCIIVISALVTFSLRAAMLINLNLALNLILLCTAIEGYLETMPHVSSSSVPLDSATQSLAGRLEVVRSYVHEEVWKPYFLLALPSS